MNMKKTAIAVLTMSALFSSMAAASVNDGLFFDLGFDTTKTGAKQIGNLMTVGKEGGWDSATKGYPTTIADQDPVRIDSAEIQGGYWKYSSVTNEMPILVIPQGTKTTEDGKYYTAQQTVQFNDVHTNVNVRSGFIRFRWDGYAFTNILDVIMVGDCWKWASESKDSRGIAFGVTANAELNVWVGRTSSTRSACKLIEGKWYDIAFCATNCADGGANVRFVFAVDGTSTWHNVRYDSTQSLNMKGATSENIVMIGGQDSNANDWLEFDPSASRRRKAFKGAVANIKLWSRALDDRELLAAIAGYDGMQWSIGAQNGSADEFGGSPAEEFDPVNDKWAKMRKTLDSDNRYLVLKTKMEAVDSGLQKSLRVKPILSEGASGAVSLLVNDMEVESANLENGKDFVFVIPSSKWIADRNGNISVKILRTGDIAGTLQFDDISLSGGWQAGMNDNAVPALHEKHTPQNFFVGDFDFDNHLRKATFSDLYTYNTDITRFYIHFWVDGRMATKSDAVFKTEILNKPQNEASTLFKVYLNDNEIGSVDCIKKYTTIQLNIPRNTMRAGLNKIELRNCSGRADEWAQYDYFRLEFSREYLPFAISVR